ncbi:hypothetical protein Hanom_Chr10g00875451 [Helianthus anomalus]
MMSWSSGPIRRWGGFSLRGSRPGCREFEARLPPCSWQVACGGFQPSDALAPTRTEAV